jgi:hypothetical protein
MDKPDIKNYKNQWYYLYDILNYELFKGELPYNVIEIGLEEEELGSYEREVFEKGSNEEEMIGKITINRYCAAYYSLKELIILMVHEMVHCALRSEEEKYPKNKHEYNLFGKYMKSIGIKCEYTREMEYGCNEKIIEGSMVEKVYKRLQEDCFILSMRPLIKKTENVYTVNYKEIRNEKSLQVKRGDEWKEIRILDYWMTGDNEQIAIVEETNKVEDIKK